ncbi:NAD(P)/FAD-dependent oxidoreductase [Pandoraea communis]|uniref:NAD(P)/FAD-dependent oxidoreductase n=1 Tax=Pandoraea communis TaxID=2508297 RepID=UPI0025A4CD6B|nr:NAD(P)/FAD-dependent oxidoreductase [Pandoraea communis]MDM8354993.1 NAD(P)/FAD-dependent oxidoreductase [Pandoraea communis]
MRRRDFLLGLGSATAWAGATPALAAPLWPTPVKGRARVIVIGGGFGGATAAKALRLLSGHTIDVTLVEPNPAFVSSPLSNLVVGGNLRVSDLTVSYDGLVARHGIVWRRTRASAIDAANKRVQLADGGRLPYDKLIVAPGVSLRRDAIAGLSDPAIRDALPVAWTDARESAALHARLQAMPDGGVFAVTIPEAPFRCPPAPYERACQAAAWLKRHKPRAKVLIFDANDQVLAEAEQFHEVWRTQFAGIVEYHPQFNCTDVAIDGAKQMARFELGEEVRADVLNVIPPMRAGDIAVESGLATANGRWCDVDFLTFASKAQPDVHVLGDAIQIAPQMPKSGHMANQHAKVCAAAIVATLSGHPVNPEPLYSNTCYTFVSATEAMHVASVHRYDAAQHTMLPVPGTGGASPRATRDEFALGLAWAQGIWADTLA